jgi:hypothetical protein
MILVCNLYKETELELDVPYIKVMNIPYDFNCSLYKNIGIGGIEIEEELLKHDSTWGSNPKFTLVILSWESNSFDIEKVIKSISQVRSDEIYLESIKPNHNHNWIFGHKNSVVTLTSALMSVNTLVLNDYEKIYDNMIIWMANRIGLNVFEL